ncbi:MAG: Gfo/Idh/MocA family oxidoreductase, partial [Planctomycetota bacterium]|nr:Gfo/Idh/MocA family oxidoreductase [Planctomycetota bacterium]
MNDSRYQVAVIGCGRMGVDYAEAFHAYHDCNLSALVDPDPSRREEVGRRFGVQASFPDPVSMLRERVPDIVSVVTPTRFIPECVISCAQAGVQAISAEKPITAKLSDGDAMLVACHENGVVFSGGNLQRAKNEVQHAAQVIRDGGIGSLEGACMSLGNELSGGGVQPISVLRLLAGAEVESAVGWVHPPEAAESELDTCEVQG